MCQGVRHSWEGLSSYIRYPGRILEIYIYIIYIILEISSRIPDSEIISLSSPDIWPDMISGAPLRKTIYIFDLHG